MSIVDSAAPCLHQLVEEQVARSPARIAVASDSESITYRTLNERANQLAWALRALGVGHDVPVGVCLDRTIDLVVALLGILKAGGAYVPLDPTYPVERLEFALAESAAPVLITDDRLRASLGLNAPAVVRIDADGPLLRVQSLDAPANVAEPDSLAYIMFTSGSTGRPKGVMVPHRAVGNLLLWARAALPLTGDDRILQRSPNGFDVSVWELFAPLICGARVVLPPIDAAADPARLIATINEHRVTVLQVVPSLLRLLLEHEGFGGCSTLRHVLCAGDVLSPDLQERFFDQLDAELTNLYGPTETTVYSLCWTCERGARNRTVPIGHPIARTDVCVLDADGRPVAAGETGELYIGGMGVARGYINRPDLTAERFVPDPLRTNPSARFYRTGDLVTLRDDGVMEFVGRVDHQVKIRGNRVELGEIESVLRQSPCVRDVAVTTREDSAGDAVLVAYVIPAREPLDVAELRNTLRRRLPSYMMPAAYIPLERFPLNSSGKVDRRALGALSVDVQTSRDRFEMPRTAVERVLANLWEQGLQHRRVGAHDNFFDLGGHSLLSVRLIVDINRALDVKLTVSDLYEHPTVAQLALLVERQTHAGARTPAVVQMQSGDGDPSVFFIHAGPWEFRLAQLLAGRRAVYGIEVPVPLRWRAAAVRRDRAAMPTLEQLAEPFVSQLCAHPASKRCVIAGFSFAGIIAFEVARQFQRRGGRIELVMLLDSNVEELRAANRSQGFWGRMRSRVSEYRHRALTLVRPDVPGPIGSDVFSGIFDEKGELVPWPLLLRIYERAQRGSPLRPFHGPGVLFRARDRQDADVEDSLGWGGLFTGGLDVVVVRGDHNSMIEEGENSRKLAWQVDEALDRRARPNWARADRSARTA